MSFQTTSASSPGDPYGPGNFRPTRWSLVMRARGPGSEARAALSELCAAYWEPVFRSLRGSGTAEDVAREQAQEFFAKVLAGDGFPGADPARGRFRSYLLGALRHVLNDLRDRERRQKRGGGVRPESLDAEGFPEPEDPSGGFRDRDFDRAWAMAVMSRAMASVELDLAGAGRSPQFAALRPWLAGTPDAEAQARVRSELGLSDGALKVAVHRFRRHFRDAVRDEIRQTLPDGAQVEDELRYLVEVVGNS